MEAYLYEDLYQLEETHWWHRAKRAFVREALQRLETLQRLNLNVRTSPKTKDVELLDIGCGTGKSLEEFSKIISSAGIDMSAEALKFCHARGLKNVQQADSYSIPYKNNSLKIVTLLDVLEHTEDDKTLEEIWRVLEPDGFLIITVPALPWLWSNWDVVLHHYRRYTVRSLNDVLHRHGFQAVHLSYAYSFLVLPVILVRWVKSMRPQQSYDSDFKLNSPLVNSFFLWLAAVERWFVWHTGVPIGTSVFAVAQKVEHEAANTKTSKKTHLVRRTRV